MRKSGSKSSGSYSIGSNLTGSNSTGSDSTGSDDGADKTSVDPFQKALGLLVRREHSRRELVRNLVDRGAESDRSEDALDRLAELGYQNDDRFACALARTRAAAGYGPQRIRAELATHALTAEQIAVALEACETDWHARAGELVARRFSGAKLADPKQRRKAIEFLLRRGFDHASTYAAVKQTLED
jgi:regulatory protein